MELQNVQKCGTHGLHFGGAGAMKYKQLQSAGSILMIHFCPDCVKAGIRHFVACNDLRFKLLCHGSVYTFYLSHTDTGHSARFLVRSF
jgi:hypothetical protein